MSHGLKPMLRVVAYHSQLTKTDNLGAMMATLEEILKPDSLGQVFNSKKSDAVAHHIVRFSKILGVVKS